MQRARRGLPEGRREPARRLSPAPVDVMARRPAPGAQSFRRPHGLSFLRASGAGPGRGLPTGRKNEKGINVERPTGYVWDHPGNGSDDGKVLKSARRQVRESDSGKVRGRRPGNAGPGRPRPKRPGIRVERAPGHEALRRRRLLQTKRVISLRQHNPAGVPGGTGGGVRQRAERRPTSQHAPAPGRPPPQEANFAQFGQPRDIACGVGQGRWL